MNAHELVGSVVVGGEGADDRLRVVEEEQRVVRGDPTLHLRDHTRRHPDVRVEPIISLKKMQIYGSKFAQRIEG